MELFKKLILLFYLGICCYHNAFSSEITDDPLATVEDVPTPMPEDDNVQVTENGVHKEEDGPASVEQALTKPIDSGTANDTTGVDEADKSMNTSNVNGVNVLNETEIADESLKNNSKNSRPTKVQCITNNTKEFVELTVMILNGSALPNSLQTTPNLTVANCALTLFYVPWCHFSTSAARNYNALPRLYPDINCFAVNSAAYSSLNARYGTVAVPTLLLFHNGQPVAKFNDTQYTLEKFVEFIRKNTGVEPTGDVKLTSADIKGPLPGSPVEETDYLLWLAWVFLISCCCYGVTKSVVWQSLVETLRNNWQEAEAQHEHAD